MEMYVLNIASLRGREDEALSLLSPDRRETALRRRGDERLRSLAGGLLLMRHIGPGPFEYSDRGKPFLPGGPCFSLSHAGDRAALALHGAPVGADIERPRTVRPAVLRRALTDAEQDWVSAGDEEKRFAFLWTRKESVLKWDGRGVGYPMRAFSVLPGEETVFEGRSLSLHTVRLGDSYLTAAAEGSAEFTPREEYL